MTDRRDRQQDGRRVGVADEALRRHGITGIDLAKLAQRASADALRRMKPPPVLSLQEKQDLVGWLIESGLRWAIVYDASLDQRANFATSVYARMRTRVIDWCRTNVHDARHGTDKRHMAVDTSKWDNGGDRNDLLEPEWSTDVEEGRPTVPWADSARDAFVEPDFQDATVSRMRIQRYELAAAKRGMTVEQWTLIVLDDAASELEDAA